MELDNTKQRQVTLLVQVAGIMANTIPCPNPVCVHQFSQAELQTAAQLLCPKCGFRMAGRGAAPAKPAVPIAVPAKPAKPPAPASWLEATPAKPAKPAPNQSPGSWLESVLAKPAPPAAQPIQIPGLKAVPAAKIAVAQPAPQAKPALAQPVQAPKMATPIAQATPVFSTGPTPPMAMPIASAPNPEFAIGAAPVSGEASGDGAFFNPAIGKSPGTLVRSGKSGRSFNWMRLLVNLLAIGFAACVVIVALYALVTIFVGPEGFQGFTRNGTSKGNIYFGNIPGQQGPEKIYKLLLARDEWEVDKEVKRGFEAHAAWKHTQYDFWFAVVYKDYGMLKPRDAEMLRAGIDKLENMFGDALELGKKAEPTRFAELPAQKLAFKGQMKSANWLGECYMFFNNGVAYWVYISSPDWAVVEYFAAEMPDKNFFVQSDRRGWREQAPPLETFASLNGKIAMAAPKDVWERIPNPKNLDENGELFLLGKYRKEKEPDNRKNAALLIFTLPKQEDLKSAVKAARDYLDKTKNENTKIEAADEKLESETIDVGNRRGRMIDLKLLYDGEPKRYYLLAVINEPDAAYGIKCECTWESRQIWRQDFIDVLRSMQVKKGE